jgi:dipeptidyl aminopeptidase/acylaminoacyl peptidase
MKIISKLCVVGLLSGSITACMTTKVAEPPGKQSVSSVLAPEVKTLTPQASQSHTSTDVALTMEQIMSDPDWMGTNPTSPYWSADSKTIYYSRKQLGTPVKDLWQLNPDSEGNGNKVSLAAMHLNNHGKAVYSQDRKSVAWLFKGNLFVKNLATAQTKQLTRGTLNASKLMFLNDGRIAFRSGNQFIAIDIDSGMSEVLASWLFDKAPKANQKPKDYLAEQQIDLIEFVQVKRNNRVHQFNYQQALSEQNSSITPRSFYLPEKQRTVEASLSPNGNWVIVSVRKDLPTRTDEDIMPDYIGEDGRIKTQSVRRRVADATSSGQTLWLFDLQNGNKRKLGFQGLPGYNDDVLAEVKRENAEAKGEDYQTNRLPRDIKLMVDSGWDQSAIQWHNNGDNVAIMLESWDNKDRWITTVDFDRKTLVSQDRLQDEAWINYRFNNFGWLNNQTALYFLSERSGYSQLYTKSFDGQRTPLTSGKYEISSPTLSQNDQYIYFTANKKHPGIYEIYRVEISTGKIEALTDLNGKSTYVLSPDENALLLTHSKVTQPPELYHLDLADGNKATRLTNTSSEAFNSIPWVAPKIVPVKSTHTVEPIYSRVYMPADFNQGEKRRAVIFSHGAGYLQNSHLGWSIYFREFMFHSLLVQQGYVVMDMDYRASAGYGRDWRTAIYRQMGKPEIEDLQDGVDWLVENANVDRGRIGTYGGSYGGFMTFMALFTKPELFQAGAALRPVSDWAHYNHGYTSNILNTPDVDPIAYERSSPIYFAEGLNKPLLINAPMLDNNVFFVDVVRLVQRLIELEKTDFETAIYPVESHGFIQPSSWLDEYRRIYKLFEDNL